MTFYIPSLKCPSCGSVGRPGELDFDSRVVDGGYQIICSCGTVLPDPAPFDHNILSRNQFVRLLALSNHLEYGDLTLVPGRTVEVSFARPFDLPCRAFFVGPACLIARELALRSEGMTVLSASSDQSLAPMDAYFLVCGLVDITSYPEWFLHFYGALTSLTNGFFKSALLDYAVAFESFIDLYLRIGLTSRCGGPIAEHILHRTLTAERRVKELLPLAIGAPLPSALYAAWDAHIRLPRNRLAHGELVQIGQEEAELAHEAFYDATRWIEDSARGRQRGSAV